MHWPGQFLETVHFLSYNAWGISSFQSPSLNDGGFASLLWRRESGSLEIVMEIGKYFKRFAVISELQFALLRTFWKLRNSENITHQNRSFSENATIPTKFSRNLVIATPLPHLNLTTFSSIYKCISHHVTDLTAVNKVVRRAHFGIFHFSVQFACGVTQKDKLSCQQRNFVQWRPSCWAESASLNDLSTVFKLSADILLWSFEKIVPLIAEYGASNNKEDEFDFQVGFICIATRY